jgi:Cu(I)-responsive transcriptional regulator
MEQQFTIGEVAGATGTRAETIRYYEKIGLLDAPPRSEGNYRKYGPENVRRLGFVRRARELGFSVEQVRALLELADHRDHDCCRVDELAQDHLANIDRKIADLTALRRELGSLLESCHGGTVANCRILEALAPSAEP